MTRLLARFAAVVVVAVLAAAPAVARSLQGQPTPVQDPAAASPAEGAVEAGQAIPTTDIPTRAEAINQELTRIGVLIDVDPQVATIESQLEETADVINTDFERLQTLDVNTVALRTLSDLRGVWVAHQREIAGPLATVTSRYRGLQGELVTLSRIREDWELTLTDLADSVRSEDVPEELAVTLRARIDVVLTSIDSTRQRLQARSDEVLQVQSEVSSLDARVSEALAFIDQLSSEVRQRVLSRDAPPIWSLGSDDVESLGGEARDALSDRFTTAREFFVRHRGQSAAHFVVFLIFAAVAFGMGRQARRWEEIGDTEPLRSMLARPVSIAAIFALLAGSWFYTGVPTAVTDLFLIVTLFPVARLAPVLIRRGDRSTVYGLLGSYGAVRVIGLMAEGSGLRRVSLFLLSAVVLFGLFRFLRVRIPEMTEDPGGWRKLAAFFLRVAVPLLAAALVANLLGWTRLAWVITSGAISSAYAAVILWLFAIAAAGLGAIVPATRLGDALPSLRRNAHDVSRTIRIVAQLAALWIWTDVTLTWFLVRAPVERWLRAFADSTQNLGGLEIRVGSILAALAILVVTPLVSRLVRFFFMEEIRPRLSLPRGSADGVASLFHYIILTIGVLLAATAAGIDSTQLTLVAGALGVGIGFGLQNIVSNFISGLILIFERPISVGDRIAVGATQEVGIVTRIGIRASTVRTFNGAEVVVPNSDLISKEVTNWTLSDMQRRLELKIGVRYGTDPRQVLDLLRNAAAGHEGVLTEPEAIAVFDGFGESSLDFRLLYWVPMENLLAVKTEMNLAVHEALKEADVRVAFPRRDLRIQRAGGPAAALGDDEESGSALEDEST